MTHPSIDAQICIPTIKLHQQVNGKSFLCDLYRFQNHFSKQKSIVSMPRICAFCIQHIKRYVDVFFAVIIINNGKHYTDTLSVCIASAASPQIMVDHGREAAGEREIFDRCLHSTQANRGLTLIVCIIQCIKIFQCFTSFTTSEK